MATVGYWSKHFKKEQVRWSTFERELYAVQQGLRHFRSEVEGRHVVVWTDHQPLVYAVKAESLPHLGKCHRQLIEIAQYMHCLTYFLKRNRTSRAEIKLNNLFWKELE